MKRKYSNEEKQKIIDRYISGEESSANILADTEIPKSTFYNWLKQHKLEQERIKRKPIITVIFNCLKTRWSVWKVLLQS